MKSIFRPAAKGMVFQDVVEQIQKAILKRHLKPSQKLPAEKALMQLFHTSRTTIREALRVIEFKGLIQAKTGSRGGAYIRSSPANLTLEDINLLIGFEKISLADLADFRMTLEGALAQKAARQATAEDVQDLNRLLGKIRTSLKDGERGSARCIELDKNLHLRIAAIAGNPFEIHLLRSVYAANDYFDRFHEISGPAIEKNYQDLAALVRAVACHCPGRARTRAIEHVAEFGQYLKV